MALEECIENMVMDVQAPGPSFHPLHTWGSLAGPFKGIAWRNVGRNKAEETLGQAVVSSAELFTLQIIQTVSRLHKT